MPLMFSISGYVAAMSWHKAKESGNCARKFARSAKRLLIPYVLGAMVVIPLANAGIVDDIGRAFSDAWYKALVLNRSLWFLPCCFFLICVHVLSTRILTLVKDNEGRRSMLRLLGVKALCFAIALLPIGVCYFFCPKIDYFRSVLSYAPSFLAGVLIFEFLTAKFHSLDVALDSMSEHDGKRKSSVLCCLAFLALVLGYVWVGRPAFKPLVGLASLVPIALLARLLARSPFCARVLSFVGQSTLLIYCMEFFMTPMTIWRLACLNAAGALSAPLLILLTILYVPIGIAVICFIRVLYLGNIKS